MWAACFSFRKKNWFFLLLVSWYLREILENCGAALCLSNLSTGGRLKSFFFSFLSRRDTLQFTSRKMEQLWTLIRWSHKKIAENAACSFNFIYSMLTMRLLTFPIAKKKKLFLYAKVVWIININLFLYIVCNRYLFYLLDDKIEKYWVTNFRQEICDEIYSVKTLEAYNKSCFSLFFHMMFAVYFCKRQFFIFFHQINYNGQK